MRPELRDNLNFWPSLTSWYFLPVKEEKELIRAEKNIGYGTYRPRL